LNHSLNQFISELSALGLTSSEECATLLQEIPAPEQPQTAEQMAELLVRKNRLTAFQQQRIFSGEGSSLVMGNYLILDQLGKGGMGVVLKARHQRMDRLVALKVMATSEVHSPEAVKRFQREVQAAARLTHPNIVIAYDADEAAGSYFLVMEYVAGMDLYQHVQQQGPLSVEDAAGLVIQAARGLEFSHRQGVIHRDIKPANLLLDHQGVVKILDMGLARLEGSLGNNANGSGLTSTGAIMGTVDFMSPEQAVDTKHADARSDIYSLGCTFYYLISTETLYQGDTLMKRLLAHQSAPVPPLLERLPGAPENELEKARFEEINAIFLRMVAKRPEDRYQTMTEVIANLEQFLQTQEGSPPLWRRPPSHESSFVLSPPSATAQGKSAAAPKLKTGGLHLPTVVLPQQSAPVETIIASGEPALETIIQGRDSSTRTRNRTQHKSLLVSGIVIILLAGLGGWGILRGRGTGRSDPDPAPSIPSATTAGTVVIPRERPSAGDFAPVSDPSIIWTPDAAQKAFFDHVATLTPEQQGEAVRKKMVEINPGLRDNEITYQIRGMAVDELKCLSDAEEISIWPIRALSQLKSLSLRGATYTGHGEWRQRGVSDLSPLAGLSLNRLQVQGSPISDLAPLHGMPLRSLDLDITSVTNLSPLKGMPILFLSFNGVPVSDLEPLREMRLRALSCGFTPVSDLSPLAEMPLETLNVAGSKVTDFEPLRGMPLTLLDCRMLNISDFSPLRQSPLKSLICSRIPPDQFSTIQQLPLEEFDCSGKYLPEYRSFLRRISTLRLINGKPAKEVLDALPAEPRKTANWTPDATQKAFFDHVATLTPEQQGEAVRKKMIEINPELRDHEITYQIEGGHAAVFGYRSDAMKIDIWPIRAFPQLRALDFLGASYTGLGEWKRRGVSDLSPLAGLPLTRLQIQGSLVQDLSPLRGMPLDSLNIDVSLVSSLDSLEGMPLSLLTFNGTAVADLSPLQGMPLKILTCAFTPVSDLSPLRGLSLTRLNLAGSKVTDLGPLLGMPLQTLDCHVLKISDFSPLRQSPLKSLICSRIPPDQFSIIQQLPLEEFECDGKYLPEYRPFLRRISTLRLINRKPAKEVLDALPTEPRKTAFWAPDTAQKAFFDEVATLTPEQQGEAVRKKLAEINPGWNAREFSYVIAKDNEQMGKEWVREVLIPPTHERLEIWPIRALTSLKHFESRAPRTAPEEQWQPQGIEDLSPLRGLPLTFFVLERSPVHSLEPLSEMPLEYLGLSYTQISDLSPVRKIPLKALGITGTQVTDLSPLEGMPISELYCGGLPLSDLSQVASLPLTRLGCFNTSISDLSLLRGKSLVHLDINMTNVEDLSPLKGMPLETLFCNKTRVSDLTPLSGMPLKNLNLLKTPVKDLSPLKGTPLKILNIVSTDVTTLEPLQGVPLEELSCNSSFLAKNALLLKSMPTLKRINSKPADEVLESLKPVPPPQVLSSLQEKAGSSEVSTDRMRAPAR